MSENYTYAEKVFIALDQLCNALSGGMPDETISARCYRLDGKEKFWTYMRRFIDGMFFWQTNHCEYAYQSEYFKRQLPSEYSKEPEIKVVEKVVEKIVEVPAPVEAQPVVKAKRKYTRKSKAE